MEKIILLIGIILTVINLYQIGKKRLSNRKFIEKMIRKIEDNKGRH